MKILLYNDTYKHIGGAETYCLELMPKLKNLGHEVYWLAHGLSESIVDDSHIVLPVFNEGKFNYFKSKYFFNKTAYLAIKEKLATIRPDVIHIHHNRYYTFSLMRAIKELSIPIVQTIHDYTLLCPSQYYPDLYYKNPGKKNRRENCQLICSQGSCLPLKSRLGHPFAHDRKRKKIIHEIPTFIAPSIQLKSYLKKAGFKNVVHLPFFVDHKRWSFHLERKNQNVILFVGRVEANKGIHLLIDSFLLIQKKMPDVQLIIAGDGSQVEVIKHQIKINNWRNIDVLGFVNYNEIASYYNKANILVVPSLDMEQFGLIGIEGLASGVAVIGSDTGGIPEWCIHEKTGLLFNPEKPKELTIMLERMLNNQKLAKELTRNGIQLIKEVYNEEQHFKSLIHLYKTAKKIK